MKVLKWLCLLLVLGGIAAGASGCLTTNLKHDAKHMRVAREQLYDLHKEIDFYIME